jgi:serine protease Do
VVAFGDDTRLRVGDWVVAVGNPFGLGGTVTAGIVSSMGRDIGSSSYYDYIQIDAPINQGNSGGPTFDLTGRVMGMNSAIFSPSGGSVGIGFAIPASTVQAVVDQLKQHGSVARGWLGVQIQPLTPDMASSIGLAGSKGAIVASVLPDSPALRAGFQQGDVILSMNGQNVTDSRDLTRKVASVRAGDRANFVVVRDGMRRTVTAMIEKRDAEKLASFGEQQQTPAPGPRDAGPAATSSLGLSLVPLNPAGRQQYKVDEKVNGVLVTKVDPNSEAADKGFGAGDVIVAVGNRPVRTPADLTKAIADAKAAGRDSVLLLVADSQAGQIYKALKIG